MQAEILVEKGKIARLMIELEEVKENSARLHTESLSKQAKIDQLEVRRSQPLGINLISCDLHESSLMLRVCP
jgi:FtsZ-binding cell division protein ZapB